MTRIIRIAVNNLAGVPSIVYGIFGLGFFVYILGGNIDALFFQCGTIVPLIEGHSHQKATPLIISLISGVPYL
jgi:ABC-type phosphate transport system permease subunit